MFSRVTSRDTHTISVEEKEISKHIDFVLNEEISKIITVFQITVSH